MIVRETSPVMLDLSLAREMVQLAKQTIASAYCQGRGIASSSEGNMFALTIWARDASLISLVSRFFPEEMMETLKTLISHQHESGIMPIRVGWIDVFWGYVWGVFGKRKWAYLKEGTPWNELSRRAVPARDIAYSIVMACHNIFQGSEKGKGFVRTFFPSLIRALEAEERHVDQADQLAVSRPCSDWGDCLKRKGKLASVNIMRYQALRVAASMTLSFGSKSEAISFIHRAKQVRSSLIEACWDDERGCFIVSSQDKRLDTFANITACLVLPDIDQCVRIQDALEREARDPSGLLRNFSVPYPWWKVSLIRTAGMIKYGNSALYPCFSDLNILAQARIARCHRDKETTQAFSDRAMLRFVQQTNTYKRLGSFHEVLDPKTLEPLEHHLRGHFRSHSSFVPAAAAYLAAAAALLGAEIE